MGPRERRAGAAPATVFLAPGLPDTLVERSRLEPLLGSPGSMGLSLVVGPPGAGKTTSVRAWLGDVDVAWAWLTLDEPESGPERLWTLAIRAVQATRPDLVLDAMDALAAEPFDWQLVASTLVEDLVVAHLEGSPLVVVIDDAHLLSGEAWQQVAWLLQHHPPGLHLVLISRSDPPFSLARLRAGGTVGEVRQRDLAFDASEAVDLFARALGADQDVAELARGLQEQTGGWAAGLRLALLALERGADRAELESSVSEWRGTMAELLVSEVLERQPADIREFLRCMSVVAVLHPDLCDAVAVRSDSRQVLRRLAADQVFVARVQDAPDLYRYHPMLAELLRYELHAEGAAIEAAVHQRAAAWYASQAQPADAIEHYLAAGDHDAAFELLIAELARLHGEGRGKQIGAWLACLRDEEVAADPERMVTYCGALLLVARREWVGWWQRADELVGADRPDLRQRLNRYRAIGYATQGHVEPFERLVATLDAELPDAFDELVMAWRARMLSLDGRHDEAISVASSLVAARRILVRDPPASSVLAGILRAAGYLERAAVASDKAVTGWRALGEPDLLGMVDALCVASEILLARGALDDAEDLVASALALCHQPPPHLLTIKAVVAACNLDRARGHHDEARRRAVEVGEDARVAGVDERLLRLLDDQIGRISPATTSVRPASPGQLVGLGEELTDRECMILRLLQSHLTFPEIGRELYISRHTVKTHALRIYRKLGVSSRSSAIAQARRLGLVA